MIEILTGKLLVQKPTLYIIENNGMGIAVQVPVGTGGNLVLGEPISLHTHLHLQVNARSGETSLALYGFGRETDREVFRLLISISGIGPKAALRILSEATPEDLAAIVKTDNPAGLTRLKGIGKKTAEVLLPQLKNAFEKIDLQSTTSLIGNTASSAAQDAIWALISLGVKEGTASKAVSQALQALGESADSAQLVPEALKHT
jgi:holliday junction DNA helicase RuvA